MPERHWYQYFDVYVFSEIALRTDGLQLCKVDLGSQIDSVQTLVAQESSGFPMAAFASEAFAGPRKKRATATATSMPMSEPTA